ncbi:tetratricopeptide repeat protein [Maricaulis sp.]|uniref:tetratricopeptide repeat protein n=1 Tax=Maricaulis sp. TaxID=1486257 RepID=UPI00261121B2|nr:tetratricopeptide repeat protein [Maricaulis sp.]
MKRVVGLSFIVLASSLLSACVSVPEDEPSVYGAFLAARYAREHRDADGAASYYAAAAEQSPGDVTLADHTYITSLLAGRMDDAARFARDSVEMGDPSRLASLYLSTDLMAGRRYSEAVDVLDAAPPYGPFNAFIAEIFLHWALVGDDRSEIALTQARRMSAHGELLPFIAFHRAMLEEAAGDLEAADQGYRAAVFGSAFPRMTTLIYGGFLERQGEADNARALYREYLATIPTDPIVLDALARVDAGGRPPRRPTEAQAAALAAFGPAASLAAQADMDIIALYLRMIQRLDPDLQANRLLLGEVLQRINLPEAALVEYESVPEGPHYIAAQVDLIWLTARLNRMEAATAMARELLQETGDNEARLILADLLRVNGGCGEAAGLYADVIASKAESGLPIDWRYHYFRASCLFLQGDDVAAEQEYLQALATGPDQAQVLNDLGYLWIDRGERLDEAFAMVARAAELEPERGHIIDSLGWAHYRLGNYEAAVLTLERAAALSPGSATANFHLGDAYWQVGRRLEARFQWQRALDLDADEDEREALLERLEHGLPEPESVEYVESAQQPATP